MKGSDLALQFTTTDKAVESSGIKVLVYGRAGMGKTTLCATAPAPLIISAESGLLSLRHVKVPVAKVYSYADVKEVFDWVRANAHKQGLRTICLDSLTEIAEQVLTAAKAKTKDPRQAYGDLIQDMIVLVKDFRDLPQLNVVVTAKEDAVTNSVTGVTQYGPKAPGKTVGPELPYLFDEVFHASVGKDNTGKTFHYLRTRPDAMVDAKDRSGVLDEIEYPDLNAIFSKIRGVN